MTITVRPLCIMALCALLAACGNPNQRLDEYVFHDGPQFRLKVVRFYRNIPFNQLGEQAVVMCQSENTTESSGLDPQDAGWRMLGAAAASGSDSAREAALSMKDHYEVIDDLTLVAKLQVINISFDACGHFINWDPTRLPHDMIIPLEKPDACAPGGPADCRYYDFEGDRTPRYEQIHVPGKGRVSFTASSTAFRDVQRLRVATGNNGAVWHVDSVHPATGGPTLSPDSLRSLSVTTLEAGMQNVSLVEWLESALPAGSMVLWSDLAAGCGTRPESTGTPASAECAEIRFTHVDGNSGVLYLTLNTDPENGDLEAVFHAASIVSGDRTRPAGSLAGLREALAAAEE